MLNQIGSGAIIGIGLMIGLLIYAIGFNETWFVQQWRRITRSRRDRAALDVNHEPPVIIVCAAMMHRTDCTIVIGLRHWDAWMVGQLPETSPHGYPDYNRGDWEQGFLTNRGVFVDRYEALKIAERAGQVNFYRTKTSPKDRLFSEDIY